MLNFLSDVKQKAVGYAASTSLVKNNYIKPIFQKKIERAKESFGNLKTSILKNTQLKKNKPLAQAIKNLHEKSNELINALEGDDILNGLVNITGNHVGDYKTTDLFKNTVKNSPAIKDIQRLLANLMGYKSYSALSENLNNAENIEELGSDEQLAVFAFLDGNIVKQISEENKTKEILKKELTQKAKAAKKELKLSEEEHKDILIIFNTIIDDYLDAFNKIRTELIEHLPEFLKQEHTRILATHPEITAKTTSDTKTAITPAKKHQRKANENEKPNPKASKKQKMENKLESEDEIEEKEIDNVVTKKTVVKKGGKK